MLTRRHAFFAGTTALAALFVGRLRRTGAARAATTYEVTHTDEEWRKLLTPRSVPGASPRRHRTAFHQPALR